MERILVGLRIPQVRWSLRAGQVLVLAYHNVVPRGERPAGERTLHLSQASFAEQLDLLASSFEVVSLAGVLNGPETPRYSRPRAVITWDDAYAGALEAGIEEVGKRGLPATIFVAPGTLGGRTFWWDFLAEGSGGSLAPALRMRALEEARGEQERVLELFGPQPVPELPEHARGASEQALMAAAAKPGITVASHSWSHPNLARLGPEEVRLELVRARDWLSARIPNALPWLAYPYGLATPPVRAIAREAGIVAALRIEGGWMRRSPEDRFDLPRVNIPAGVSRAGFLLRLGGLVGR